jgi:hypothetical protein
MTTQERKEIKEKVLRGLELSYERLLADKRAKNTEIVVMRNNKIVTIKP